MWACSGPPPVADAGLLGRPKPGPACLSNSPGWASGTALLQTQGVSCRSAIHRADASWQGKPYALARGWPQGPPPPSPKAEQAVCKLGAALAGQRNKQWGLTQAP